MRRILLILLVLLMVGSTAFSEEIWSAHDLALQLAQVMDHMDEIKEMPLKNGAQNRAIWTDTRTDAKCALTVYLDAEDAQDAALQLVTRHTSVRMVESCLLEIDADLAMENIDAYQLALADMLGVELVEEEPDYILNVNSRKIHLPSCSSVDEMKESNRMAYTGDLEKLLETGYEACKRCNP